MAQHFLLSAAARTLSLKAIFSEGEEAAYRRFCKLRWPETNGAPVCPDCGCIEAYNLSSRRRFKCAACYRQFSVTSGTIFASRKLSFVDLLGAICLFVNASKGLSAVQLSRDLDVQYKTAFVLMHKLREAMAPETVDTTLANTVEIDGAYFGGHVRPANFKENRVDRRLLQNRTGERRVVVALRERGGRTLTRAFLREAEGVGFAKERIEPGSVVTADEAAHWDLLASTFDTHRINHSEAYSRDGIHANLAESYFSRLRRMISGQHHRVSASHLGGYAAHAAWLEDHRFESNGQLADRSIRNGLSCPVSRAWKGYWQGLDETFDKRPHANAFTLLDHGHDLAACRVPQSLNDLENDRVAQRRIGRVEIAFAHHALGELPRVQRAVGVQVPGANVGDLALLEEPVADNVDGPGLFAALEQPDRSIDVGEVMPSLRDPRLIRGDRTGDFRALLLQRLDHKRLFHTRKNPKSAAHPQSQTWCACYLRPDEGTLVLRSMIVNIVSRSFVRTLSPPL